MKKCAWTTLVTKTKYEMIAGRLYQEHQYFKSKYPMVIMVTDNLTEKDLPFLTKNNIPYVKVPLLQFSNSPNENFSMRFRDTLSKLNMLSLYDYDLVCFMDSDDLITQNIDIFIDSLDDFKGPFKLYKYSQKNIDLGINLHRGPIGGVFYGKPSKLNYMRALKLVQLEQNLDFNLINYDKWEYHLTDESFFDYNYPECVEILNESVRKFPNSDLVIDYSGTIKFWDYIENTKFKPSISSISIDDFIANLSFFWDIQCKINELDKFIKDGLEKIK